MTSENPTPTLDLSTLPEPIVDTDSVLRHVRGEQAEAERLRSEHVMPLVTGGNYDDFLFPLDESDPLLRKEESNADDSNVTKENAEKRGITQQMSSNEEEHDDNDYPLSDLMKSNKVERKPRDNDSNDDDDDDDDYPLATLKKRNDSTNALQRNDGNDDDCLLSRKTNRNSRKRDNSFTTESLREDEEMSQAGAVLASAGIAKFDVANIPKNEQQDKGNVIGFTDNLGIDDVGMRGTPEILSEDDDKNLEPEEIIMLKRLEGSITKAEESLCLDRLLSNITEAEELKMMSRLGDNISKALDRSKQPGGKVIYYVNPRKEISEDIKKQIRDFDHFEQMEALKEQLASGVENDDNAVIADLEFLGSTDITVTKEFPKFIGSTILWTKSELYVNVVEKLRKQGENMKNFHILVKDKAGVSDTVIVELSGKASVIEKAKDCILTAMKLKQLQFQTLIPRNKFATASKEHRAKLAKTRNTEFYNSFSTKYADLREIEFSGISGMSVKSSMWRMHKKKFGNVCRPSCACAINLSVITSTVIDDYIKKKQDQSNAISRVGFINNFAKKFTPLLKAEYPSDANERIYKRLLYMWEHHMKQRRFGVKCKSECPCAEGWESVFHRGRFKDELPKARNEKVSSKPSPQEKEKSIVKIPRNKSSGLSNPVPKQKEFTVSFDTRQQLGFYSVTTKKCKVLSVNSICARIDQRICKDTIILACTVGENRSVWHEIKMHDNLKQLYEKAKSQGKHIHIRFINSDVKGMPGGRTGNGWTTNNSWKGTLSTEGWAGGEYISLFKQCRMRCNIGLQTRSTNISFFLN